VARLLVFLAVFHAALEMGVSQKATVGRLLAVLAVGSGLNAIPFN
jgi:hypothetical protein